MDIKTASPSTGPVPQPPMLNHRVIPNRAKHPSEVGILPNRNGKQTTIVQESGHA
jgi:hypothetical protein